MYNNTKSYSLLAWDLKDSPVLEGSGGLWFLGIPFWVCLCFGVGTPGLVVLTGCQTENRDFEGCPHKKTQLIEGCFFRLVQRKGGSKEAKRTKLLFVFFLKRGPFGLWCLKFGRPSKLVSA